jgi:hypothetical protein
MSIVCTHAGFSGRMPWNQTYPEVLLQNYEIITRAVILRLGWTNINRPMFIISRVLLTNKDYVSTIAHAAINRYDVVSNYVLVVQYLIFRERTWLLRRHASYRGKRYTRIHVSMNCVLPDKRLVIRFTVYTDIVSDDSNVKFNSYLQFQIIQKIILVRAD